MSFWGAVMLLMLLEVMNLLVHMALPGGSLRRYASFVLGILMVYALLGPMLSLVSGAREALRQVPASFTLGEYERMNWQDYVDWYLARRGGGQE